jgi:hypothetical protein
MIKKKQLKEKKKVGKKYKNIQSMQKDVKSYIKKLEKNSKKDDQPIKDKLFKNRLKSIFDSGNKDEKALQNVLMNPEVNFGMKS